MTSSKLDSFSYYALPMPYLRKSRTLRKVLFKL